MSRKTLNTTASVESHILDFGHVRISDAALDYIYRSIGRSNLLTASTIIAARNQWSWNQSELDNVNEYLNEWDIVSKIGVPVKMMEYDIKPEYVMFDRVKDEHMVQRIEKRLKITWEQLQTDEYRKQVLETFQSYIDNAMVRLKQPALKKEIDEDGNERVVRIVKDGDNVNNSVYVSGGGTIIIEISSDARIVTFYTANEYSKDDKDTELLIKVLKRCNTEMLDISIPPEGL